MRESNLRAVGLWQQMLMQGLRVPIIGGSDYHRDTPFIFLGGPTMCLYSLSAGVSDLLDALRKGHGFISFAPNGPEVELRAGDAIMGDEVFWKNQRDIEIIARGLVAGDEIRVVTNDGAETIWKAGEDGELSTIYSLKEPGIAGIRSCPRLSTRIAHAAGVDFEPDLLQGVNIARRAAISCSR